MHSSVFGQSQYFILDSRTKTAIPFVKVFPASGQPILSDIDGMFEMDPALGKVTLRYTGYLDTTVLLGNTDKNTIYFKRNVQEVQEVTAKPGENPAHRIIRAAQDNRKLNHPMMNDAFSYKSYSKFVFDINQNIMVPDDDKDTLTANLKKYFTNQHFFVLESATRRLFFPPSKDKEEILAYKISGISDPSLSTFAQSMQSFNFYDNQFKVLGETFINPLAADGISRYLFILEDTLINESADTTYTIFFRPKKGKNFKGLEGRLYINTNGFAVEKVNAKISRVGGTGNFDATIMQEYAFINNTKWFPVKLSTNLSVGAITDKKDSINGMILGNGHTYIDSIVFNPLDKKRGLYDNIDLYTSSDAAELTEEEWSKLRTYELTDKELRTHVKVDSIVTQYNLEKRLDFIRELGKAKLQLGYVSIPLERLVTFNQYEGYRAGAGLETSSKVSKRFVIGGYAGWGTRDKEWKYGGYSSIVFSPKRSTKLNLDFRQDLLERGGRKFDQGFFDINNPDILRYYFVKQMERQRIAEIALSTDIKANMNVRLIGNYQRIEFTENYQFTPADTSIYSNPVKVDVAEIGVEAKWNIGEKYMLLGATKVSEGLKYPSIRVKAMRGISGIGESNYDYWRLNMDISQKISVRDYFTLNLRLTADKTIGDVPLFLMHNGKGTRIDWMVDAENTFQTMLAGSFYSREQIAFFTRLKFKAFHTKAKWNEPRIGLHHALGFGDFSNRTDHQLDFKTMEKGYFEAGLTMDNMLILNKVSGFGLGVFYNYSATADPDWKKNVVPKLTLNFVL